MLAAEREGPGADGTNGADIFGKTSLFSSLMPSSYFFFPERVNQDMHKIEFSCTSHEKEAPSHSLQLALSRHWLGVMPEKRLKILAK